MAGCGWLLALVVLHALGTCAVHGAAEPPHALPGGSFHLPVPGTREQRPTPTYPAELTVTRLDSPETMPPSPGGDRSTGEGEPGSVAGIGLAADAGDGMPALGWADGAASAAATPGNSTAAMMAEAPIRAAIPVPPAGGHPVPLRTVRMRIKAAQKPAPQSQQMPLPGREYCPTGSKGTGRPTTRLQWIYRNMHKNKNGYSHMAMISQLPPRAPHRWITVWQSAKQYEGTPSQHFIYALSKDGKAWSKPLPLALGGGKGVAHNIWSPVLHRDRDRVFLFYSQSTTCMRPAMDHKPARWSPGGDIMYVTSSDGAAWSAPRRIYSGKADGGVPKVIANQLAVTKAGAWVLPFWQEMPRVHPAGCPARGTHSAGALLSRDRGKSWERSKLVPAVPHTWLIEGSVAPLSNGDVLQYFRSALGSLFASTSRDNGRSWSTPVRSGLPNPNAKANLLTLSNGWLAVAYNAEHARGVRHKLQVAVSRNKGSNWRLLAKVETSADHNMEYHYPTMAQDGCRLLVAYSVLHRARLQSGGIKLAHINMQGVSWERLREIPRQTMRRMTQELGGPEGAAAGIDATGEGEHMGIYYGNGEDHM
eukprot:jgi/Tetstr1/431966/TSEL_021443.t1